MSLDFLEKTDSLRGLLEAIRLGHKGLDVSGLAEPAIPYFLAVLSRGLKRPVVYVQPHSRPLARLEIQCRFFLGQFSEAPDALSLPALSDNPYQEIFPSLEAVSARMMVLSRVRQRPPALILTNLLGLLKPVPAPSDLDLSFLELTPGQKFERDRLLRTLAEFGYGKEDLIASPGEFAWRGGIVDVFSPWNPFPYRVEFSGDEVVSTREFDPSTQRSLSRQPQVRFPSLREFPAAPAFLEEWSRLALERGSQAAADVRKKVESLDSGEVFPTFFYWSLAHKARFVPLLSYLQDAVFVLSGPEELESEWQETLGGWRKQADSLAEEKVFCLPPEEIYPDDAWRVVSEKALRLGAFHPEESGRGFHFPFQPVPRFDNKIPFFIQYIKKLLRTRDRTYIFLSNATVRHKVAALLAQNKVPAKEEISPFASPRSGEVLLLLGRLEQGFSYGPEKVAYFSERDIFTEERVLVSRPSRKPFVSHFQDLQSNDYVVHADYGIGIFRGLVKLPVDGGSWEFIEIAFRDDDRLYVPVEDLSLVQKYSHAGAAAPPLDKLGTLGWQKTKERTKKAIEKMAKELLDLYAKRKALQGYAFSASGVWESEFEKTFEYEETEDQLRAIREVKNDMESESPMDRLVCGDVGYGKTEVALRAAFKAAMDGKQVAVLCPTTVLASQHLKTFRNRLVLFPVRTEGLTRLQSGKQQAKILEDLKRGLVDIVIGTHRLLSKDVEFHDLGLLIVDEEQRFGVQHKEKVKQLRANIDVLTLTATPIPRTLNMSLSGVRDISLIETPPKDRMAVHTVVAPFDPKLIASAIRQELSREGQVYYIHNTIEDIDDVSRQLGKLVPQAMVIAIHGRMPGAAIEKKMLDFTGGGGNVLLSTTIIENGIDIPLVNTLLVDRADHFGLSQLYQLRGRVGRSSRQAYAYFLVPRFSELTPQAKERLKALREFSELGSGFRLAARDLEIRGAGNLLGSEQSGNLEAVGFDYFMELLDQAVRELKGEKVEERKAEINLRTDIRIPEEYLPQINLRLNLYKRVSAAESLEELARIRIEVRDRFGPLPPGVDRLLDYGAVRCLARGLQIQAIDRVGNRLVLKFLPSSPADPGRITAVLKRYSGSLTPQGIMTLALRRDSDREVMNETLAALKELSDYNIMN
jgi:transcription-repair coupling factor (superfamily II helicase)